jgi:hypothetical protein
MLPLPVLRSKVRLAQLVPLPALSPRPQLLLAQLPPLPVLSPRSRVSLAQSVPMRWSARMIRLQQGTKPVPGLVQELGL